ncbi:hypothetical protein FSC37_14015 [Piscinibacter aquaticus]|uniref:Uncharacterized protein n=1 Tax=Piscinibacter aquaticus TaxID=392597 RepID=A0A5C6U4F7_9BURK|nr:hypothetical protein FSC37_14015 [Piscinibacter aquaticus]
MNAALLKTDAGHHEIRARVIALTRPARTLLVLADGARDAEQLLSMVKGASAADVQALLEAGLVVESVRRKAGPSASEAAAAPATASEPASISALGYQELYDCLNALCKEQLGLMRGFKYSLEIEKAAGVDELRAVAARFVADVRRVNGDSAAHMVMRALGMTP